jgi:quaternary ammonium compound-resistance protein SugE
MNWVFLLLAGVFETGFAVMLKKTEEFTRLWPTIAFAALAICSFLCLNKSVSGANAIPVGTAYAVWTGIGAAGAMIFGMCVYNEPATAGRIFFLSLLLVSIVGLKAVSPH